VVVVIVVVVVVQQPERGGGEEGWGRQKHWQEVEGMMQASKRAQIDEALGSV
jgi:hypothetical protein